MNPEKIGRLIHTLRKEQGLTQQQLADRLHVSDKAVSKWECGAGCPDVSLLPTLSAVFGVQMETLLSGELDSQDAVGGNMKKLTFYVCPSCGTVVTATAETEASCCGKKLNALPMVKAAEDEKLRVERIENDYFISSDHPMTKEHYLSFIALLTGDTLILKKQYPEWNAQTRIPCVGHGLLVWYCTQHGLFYQQV